MPKNNVMRWGLAALVLVVAAILGYNLPPVKQRLGWRVDFAMTYLRGVANPVGVLPTALPEPRVAVTVMPTPTPAQVAALPSPTGGAATPTPQVSPTPLPPTLTPTPLPASISLPAPAWERQDINNCGPATLTMHLRFYGWEGDQTDIADLLKPFREDRNVNVEELAYYVRTRVGWLNFEYRVGGDIPTLKKLLAAGFPVMVEESFIFDEIFWPTDDRWGAHYNLLTGYDDAGADGAGLFTTQDSFRGPDQVVTYAKLDELWRSFNRVYILIYPPEQEGQVRAILGEQWDVDANRQHALEIAQAETQSMPGDPYAWFNLGTNLVYFERYREAAQAFDQARQIGLPQRMLRYQFTPFFAYFHSRRLDDLKALTDYALKITANSEEALLWRGWGLYRAGDSNAAIESFQAALAEHPGYEDALYAIDFVRTNP